MPDITLGLKNNWKQFGLLVVINALVGGMVGLERTVVPLIGAEQFKIASSTLVVSFIVTFGVVKALSNLVSGNLADRWGRKRVLVLGWLFGLPVPFMLIVAPSWAWVVAANALLGINQGLAWSMTVIMKIDLVGPRSRGLAIGVNEFAGYVALEMAGRNGEVETRSFWSVFALASYGNKTLFAASQAGLVNNLIDGMSWGLFPLFFASFGLGVERIGALKAVYPAAWGLLQLATGPLSDRLGRKGLIVGGMWVQAAALLLTAWTRDFGGWLSGSLLLGVGTAMVYPSLIAAVSDASSPAWRARSLSVYRFWRDLGYAVGALAAGLIADRFGFVS